MSARRSPRWTSAELAVLREVYAAQGLGAAMELLPGRSWRSIYVQASKLGIKCERLPDAPKCAIQGDKLEEAIKLREEQAWSFARIGAHFGVAESSACNAVLIALCTRKGFTPAERHPNGRLTDRGMERLRWCLKKGMKGVDIQLRLALSASCVAEQRRRYDRELKENGKAPLPRPGAGETYSGAKLTREKKREVEELFMRGLGTAKIAVRTGVSKTSCTRLRSKLIRKLKREGELLPGCDAAGNRRVMVEHYRHVPDELRARCRELILKSVPVSRAAKIAGIGSCTAYRIRDELKAELGDAMPKPRLPGRTRPLQREMMLASAIPAEHFWRYRELVRDLHDADKARAALRAEIAESRVIRTFEDQLAAVANGRAAVVAAFVPRRGGPDITLGGVTGEVL